MYLTVGLAALLVFAGVKILAGAVHVEIPVALSLAVIVLILGTAIAASLIATHPRRRDIAMPVLRISSGLALGTVELAFFVLAAGIRDGAPWVGPFATAVVAAGVVAAFGAVVLAVRRASERRPTAFALPIAIGGVLAALLALALFIALD